MTWRTDSFFITSVSTRLKPRSSGWQRMSVSRRGFIRSQRGVIFNPPWRQTCHQLSTDSGKGKWFGQINHLTHWWLVSAPACLKGTADRRATTGWLKACVVLLTFHLRDDCRWVTNTSRLRFKARILTFRFARHSQEQMSQLARRLDSNSRYGGARAAVKTCAPGPDGDNTHNNQIFFFISRPVFTPFCFTITIKAHLLVPSPWPAFHLVRVTLGVTVREGCEERVLSTQSWDMSEHVSHSLLG